MNSITVAGQLGKDAEIKYMPNGDPVASFSVADSQGKDKSTIWWSASLFGKRAESLAPYLTKGQAVTITGTVTEREWTDKQGQQRKSMDVRVQDVALQGGKRDEAPRQQAAPAQRQAQKTAPGGFDDPSDDIPF
jgi:single-strand DNA-binding protein